MNPQNPGNPSKEPGYTPYDLHLRPPAQRTAIDPRYRQYPRPPDVQQSYRPPSYRPRMARFRRERRRLKLPPINLGCVVILLILACIGSITATYFLFPARANILLMGIDYADPGNYVARTDSLILFTFNPWKPTADMLSIPRDLWVTIPEIGEDRINTAHFYAESIQPGSGPAATMSVVSQNFDVNIDYYLRIRFEGFREIVDAMGGVDLILPEPMAGYPAGKVHLTGRKALAFVRDRTNSDDFFRMSQGQFMLKSLLKNLLNPLKWPRLPAVIKAFFRSVDTSFPSWEWPRLAMALLRAGPKGIDNHIITREMVTPFFTDQGANVLLPNWDAIRPLVKEIFRQE